MILRCCLSTSFILLLLYLSCVTAQTPMCNFTISTVGISPNCVPEGGPCRNLQTVLTAAQTIKCQNVSVQFASGNYTSGGFTNIILDNNYPTLQHFHAYSTNPGDVWIDAGSFGYILNSSLIPHVSFDGINFANGFNNVSTGGCLSLITPPSGFAGVFNSVFYGCVSQTIGGGLYLSTQANGHGQLNSVTLIGNTATSGGGIYLYANGGKIDVDNIIFTSNVAGMHGGGAHVRGESTGSIQFNSSLFSFNYADRGGGLAASSGGNYDNSFFRNNSATTAGGAVYLYTSRNDLTDFPLIAFSSGLTITGSLAEQGGALYINYPNVVVNSPANIRFNGAVNGSGLYLNTFQNNTRSNCGLQLNNVFVHDNGAQLYGGGLFCTSSCANMPQSHFYNNLAGENYLNGVWQNDVYCDGTCQSSFCTACNCTNGACDSCPYGCADQSLASGQYCYCYAPTDLYCDFSGPKSHKTRNIALGLTFGLVLPLILIGLVIGYFVARQRKQKFVGLENESLMGIQKYGST